MYRKMDWLARFCSLHDGGLIVQHLQGPTCCTLTAVIHYHWDAAAMTDPWKKASGYTGSMDMLGLINTSMMHHDQSVGHVHAQEWLHWWSHWSNTSHGAVQTPQGRHLRVTRGWSNSLCWENTQAGTLLDSDPARVGARRRMENRDLRASSKQIRLCFIVAPWLPASRRDLGKAFVAGMLILRENKEVFKSSR